MHVGIVAIASILSWAPSALADETPRYHPYFEAPQGPRTVDLSHAGRASGSYVTSEVEQPDLGQLDAIATEAAPAAGVPGKLPAGWVQRGNVVIPAAVASGALEADPRPIAAVEDIPGNAYPRKHTLFVNFTGGMLSPGSDNSAENKSSLAKVGMYPAFTGGEAKAIASVQALETDMAQFGIRILYLERPSKTVPYTMAMVGGNWTDTNLEDSAGGVAPGTDCGALGQRHVVYTFAGGGWSATGIASVTSQEAGHAWGLDHSLNCNSVMSYCGGGDQYFSSTCDGLCEDACQGAAGCRLTHETFCGVGNDQQNEVAELSWIFGGNEPDLEPPTVEIVEPEDGLVLEQGSDARLRALVDDNYGGYGWRFIIEHDGEVVYDQVDYAKDVDDQYRPALNFTKLEPGTYVFTVEAEDHADHLTSDSVTVVVEDDAASGDSESGGGSEGTGTSGASGDADTSTGVGASTGAVDDATNGEDGSGSSDSGAGADGGGVDPGGCACRAQGGAQPRAPAALLLLGLAGAIRRRSK